MTNIEKFRQKILELYINQGYLCSELVDLFKGKLTYAEIKKIIKENCK
ncbi:MAG: hypothetical protein IJ371_05265 [Clostridia bacterium]|nr:hypothetical protein [Clostridia bacterium]